jgi:hypothetical protein
MYQNVLVLPDGGRDYLRTVKLAALYADTVHVFSPVKLPTIEVFGELVTEALPQRQNLPRMVTFHIRELTAINRKELSAFRRRRAHREMAEWLEDYLATHPARMFLRSCVGYHSDLAALEQEGVLFSIMEHVTPTALKGIGRQAIQGWANELQAALESAKSNVNALPKNVPKLLLPGTRSNEHTICSLVELAMEYAVDEMVEEDGSNKEVLDAFENGAFSEYFAVGLFTILSAFYASKNSCATITWDRATQEFFDGCYKVLGPAIRPEDSQIAKRSAIRPQIAEAVLRDHVPDVSDMPIEAILEIRKKRAPELQWFRESLSALAVDIEDDLDGPKLAAAIDAKIQNTVKPALGAMRASIRDLQKARYRRLLSPQDAVVKFAISSAAGVTVDKPLALGAIGVVVSKLYEFIVGSDAVKSPNMTSPWSVLLDLQTTAKKHKHGTKRGKSSRGR